MSDSEYSATEFHYSDKLEFRFQEENEVCNTHDFDRLLAAGFLETSMKFHPVKLKPQQKQFSFDFNFKS